MDTLSTLTNKLVYTWMNAQLAHITASSAVSTSMEDFDVAVTQATCSNQIGEPVLVSQLVTHAGSIHTP